MADAEKCGDCIKFQPDSVNPAGGLGDCPEHVERVNRESRLEPILKYPGQRACGDYERK